MSEQDRPFFLNPGDLDEIEFEGWKIYPVIDWCWGEDGDEYECMAYDYYSPDRKFIGREMTIWECEEAIRAKSEGGRG